MQRFIDWYDRASDSDKTVLALDFRYPDFFFSES